MTDYADLIGAASRRYGLPPEYIRAVMAAESDNVPTATSHAGAMGLMQVMPGTYAELRGRYPELGEDPYDPQNSINAGTAYLREMHDRYGAPGFLAAYNAGPGRYDEYLNAGRPLPAETTRYVDTIYPQIEGIPMSGPQRLPPVPEVILGPVIGANAGIAPPLNPAGLPMTALDVPPDPRAPGPPMTPSAATVGAPPAQGGVAEFLGANPMALIGLGAGLLSAAGPSPTPQNALGPAMQGFMGGMQMDQQMADRARQQEQQAALQQAIAGAGLDPTMAALAQQFPEMFAEQMFAGGGGPFAGSGLRPDLLNQYYELQRRAASGVPLTPDEQFRMQLIQRELMVPRIATADDGRIVSIPAEELPTYPVGGGGIAGAPPAVPGQDVAGESALVSPDVASGGILAPVSPAPPATPAVSEGPPVGDGSGVRVLVPAAPDTPENLTEGQARRAIFSGRVGNAAANLNRLVGYDPGTDTLDPDGWRPGFAGVVADTIQEVTPGEALSEYAGNLATQVLAGEQGELYRTYVEQALNPILRIDSGAAVPITEYPKYYSQFIPRAGMSDVAMQARLRNLSIVAEVLDRLTPEQIEVLENTPGAETANLPPELQEVRLWVGDFLLNPGRAVGIHESLPQPPPPGTGALDGVEWEWVD